MDQDERQQFEDLRKAMEPLTRRYMADGMVTDAFREEIRSRRGKFQQINGLTAEQVKEKMEANLANGGEGLLRKLDPGIMSEDDLREATEKYGCSREDIVTAINAAREFVRSHAGDVALRVQKASPEDVKDKIVGMMGRMETI